MSKTMVSFPLGRFATAVAGTPVEIGGSLDGAVFNVNGGTPGAGVVELQVATDPPVKASTATLTFAAGTTCDRAAGSWLTDGLVVGDTVIFGKKGGLNDGVRANITTLTATRITATGTTFTSETSVTGYTVTKIVPARLSGNPSLLFAAGTTVTRATGNWFFDGFKVGQLVRFSKPGGLNNGVWAAITTLTATILTASATTFTSDEVAGYNVNGYTFATLSGSAITVATTESKCWAVPCGLTPAVRANCTTATSGTTVASLTAIQPGLGDAP